MRNRLIASLSLAFTGGLLACTDTAGPDAGATVTVRFARVAAQSGAPNAAPAAVAALPLDGDNGTLTIDEIWLVVDELKLERVADACEQVTDGEEDDGCEKVELPPFFVSVPLEGEGIGEVSADVAPGSYEQLKFETKAPDEDGTLLADIQANQFDDWSAQASMLVLGTFTPTDGEAIAFRVFFDAEVKVELELPDGEPLVVEEGGDLSVTVFVDPAIWFANADGTVTDLRMFDFDATGEVFEFEAKFQEGFTKIELDG